MCPHCRAFITTDDKVCPYCDTRVGERAFDRRNPSDALGGLIAHTHFTTFLILLVNFGLYIAMAVYAMKNTRGGGFMDIDPRTLVLFGAKYGPRIHEGDWWRLITAGFLHGGLIHIGMNSWVLYDLGAQVEEAFGTARYLLIYFVTTITGFYASMLWLPMTPSVGASAPLFGLIGAMVAYGTKMQTSQGRALRGAYVRWAIYGMLMGFLIPNVDNAAHVGGFVGGFALGYLVGTPRLVGGQEGVWKGLAALCIILTAFAFVQAFRFMATVGPQL